jgi:hypothetical protein
MKVRLRRGLGSTDHHRLAGGADFISSTSGALVAYRRAEVEVCYRLGLTPVHMEEFDPQRPAPAQVCRREVENCDVFVLLLAHRHRHINRLTGIRVLTDI